MEVILEKKELLEFWQKYGNIKELANVVNVINPITHASNKKFNYSQIIDPLYYEIDLKRNRYKDFWYIIDVDIASKNNQKILASKPELFNVLKKCKQIKYCELSMNQGLHILVNTNFNVSVNSVLKNIILKNNVESVLRLEFKIKCLVAPSKEYKCIFMNEFCKKMNRSNFVKFLNKILQIFYHFDLFAFTDQEMSVSPTIFKGQNDSSDESSSTDVSDAELTQLTETQNQLSVKRKLEDPIENEDNNFKLNSIRLNPYYNKLYDVFLNYKQTFASNSNDFVANNEYLEFQNNFDFFVRNLFKNNSCIYFGDLALFILSILYKDHFPLERDHPFYILSMTEKWIIWTTAYLNFTDMLIKNNISTSYRSNIEFDRHPLYRSITRINEYGSDMSDEESREELDSFRKKYSKPAYFQMNITNEFINFVLTTLSVVSLNLEIHFSVNMFLKMFGNVKQNMPFSVLLFKRFTSKYNMKIIKTSHKPVKGSSCGEGFIYMDHLFWQNFQGNENFIDYLISIIYPSLSVSVTDQLKSEILQMGTGLNLTKEMEIVKKNLKIWSHIIPFLNCKLTLRKENSKLSRSCIFINNYNSNDCITSVIEYDFPVKKYLTCGLNEGILNLENETRYSTYFLSMIKTIFGQDTFSGKLSVFGSIQLLMKLLVIGTFFLKNKVLQVHSILMGPAGSGKSAFLNMIQSIFGDLSKEINMESYFVSNEMNSSRSNSEETMMCFSNETNKINFTLWKTIIADFSLKGSVRDLYKSVDSKSNHCNASFITAQNADGISYDTKNPFILEKEFVRRLFPIYFSLNIGGTQDDTNAKTYYKDVKNLKILNNTNPEFKEQMRGALFFILDLIEYFKIGHWDSNKIIKSCSANLRRAVMGQYLPIKILRTQNLVFLDEIYHESSPQMITFNENDQGLVLREELMSTNKINANVLTDVNLDYIANSLKNQLKMDIRYCANVGEWKIYGAKRYRECTQVEINSFEMPHRDWLGNNKNFDENNAQSVLPPALRFYVHEDINEKFNKVVASLFNNKKISFDTLPEVDENFIQMTPEIILDNFKSFQNF